MRIVRSGIAAAMVVLPLLVVSGCAEDNEKEAGITSVPAANTGAGQIQYTNQAPPPPGTNPYAKSGNYPGAR